MEVLKFKRNQSFVQLIKKKKKKKKKKKRKKAIALDVTFPAAGFL
jgi:hypothetical protein